jgi:hypothetical protein
LGISIARNDQLALSNSTSLPSIFAFQPGYHISLIHNNPGSSVDTVKDCFVAL